jgi:hypothetical protein
MYKVYEVTNYKKYTCDDLHNNGWGWYIDTEFMSDNVTTNYKNNFKYKKNPKIMNNKLNKLYKIIEDGDIEDNIVNNKNVDIKYIISEKKNYEVSNKDICSMVIIYGLITYAIWKII